MKFKGINKYYYLTVEHMKEGKLSVCVGEVNGVLIGCVVDENTKKEIIDYLKQPK